MRFFEIARIPTGDYGDAETITPQQEPAGAKPLPGGSGYKYHVNRKGSDSLEITLYDQGRIIAELDLDELGAPIPLWQVNNVAAIPEYQGKGLGMALYGIALSVLKLTLVAGETQTMHGARQWLKLSQIPGVEIMGMKTAPKNNFKSGPDNIVLWQGPEMITYTFPVTQGTKSMKSAQRGTGIYNSAGASMIAKWTGK
jgi:GNAT superfamily N-acetyltransferase